MTLNSVMIAISVFFPEVVSERSVSYCGWQAAAGRSITSSVQLFFDFSSHRCRASVAAVSRCGMAPTPSLRRRTENRPTVGDRSRNCQCAGMTWFWAGAPCGTYICSACNVAHDLLDTQKSQSTCCTYRQTSVGMHPHHPLQCILPCRRRPTNFCATPPGLWSLYC